MKLSRLLLSWAGGKPSILARIHYLIVVEACVCWGRERERGEKKEGKNHDDEWCVLCVLFFLSGTCWESHGPMSSELDGGNLLLLMKSTGEKDEL